MAEIHVAGVAACVLIGCAMSPQAFDRLTADVSRRNAARYDTAEAGLRARGYVFADADVLYARLTDEARQRCLAAGNETPASATETVVVHVGSASEANRPPAIAMDLGVAAADACMFFREQTNQLAARRVDGTATGIVRLEAGLRLARDRHGDPVVVATSSRVVSRRRVRVKRTCDHMPSPELDPLEMPVPVPVVLASAPLPRVSMTVDEEVLDIECTENTY